MAAYDNLRAVIAANVYQNNNNEVTADMVKTAMNEMVNSLGAEFQFGGVAEPGDNPGTPDYKVAYLASVPGTYSNFGGIVVNDGEVAILKWAGSWSKEPTGIATNNSVFEIASIVNGYHAVGPILGFIGSTGLWSLPAANNVWHYIVRINPGDKLHIVGPPVAAYSYYTFLKSYPETIVAGVAVDYATGYGSGTANFPYASVAKNTDSGEIVAPNDAHFLLYSGVMVAVDRTPQGVYFGGANILSGPNGLVARVDALEAKFVDEYPHYFDSNVADVIAAVQANNLLSGYRGDSIVFVTDNHYPRNFGYTPPLVQAVRNVTNNKIYIDGGDIIDGGESRLTELARIRDYFNNISGRFGGKNIRYTYGNHDGNAEAPDHADRISDADLYAIACKPYENEVTFGIEGGVKKLYYYWDNPTQNIRYFVLDYKAGVTPTDAQYLWLSSHISELSADWRVLVVIHMCNDFVDNEWIIRAGYEDMIALLESFGDKVMAVLCGHVHTDGIAYSPVLGIPVIACARELQYEYDTINNACATFVDIDIPNQMLRLVRLGRRSANWGNVLGKDIPFRNQ